VPRSFVDSCGGWTIVLASMLAAHAFPPVIAAFRERHPGLGLSVHADGAQSIQRRLAADRW
jgi:DNA-binding transcriptional LysR family regulator